jgi:hypothetical protein
MPSSQIRTAATTKAFLINESPITITPTPPPPPPYAYALMLPFCSCSLKFTVLLIESAIHFS